MKKILAFVLVLTCNLALVAQDSDYTLSTEINYYQDAVNKSDPYISERCVLDIYYPKDKSGFRYHRLVSWRRINRRAETDTRGFKAKGVLLIVGREL